VITTDIYGKTLSNTFNSKISSYAQSIKPKVLIDWLDSRHSENVVMSTNSPHASNSAGSLGYFFSTGQASNGFERQSFLWGVCDALDVNGKTIRADGNWVAMPSNLSENYEYGWWSGDKSLSSPHISYSGYGFTTSPTLYAEFSDRKCNIIRVLTSEFYGQIDTYTIVVRTNDSGLPDPLFQETVRILDNSYYFDHYLPDSIGHDTIYKIEITVLTTKNPSDHARIQEINPIYQSDISDYVVSYSLSKNRDIHESSLPIAGSSSGSLNVVLDNTQKDFNLFSNASTFGQYLKKDLKVKVSSGWKIQQYSDLYVSKTITSNISNSSNTFSLSDTFDLPAGGAGNEFVLEIDPNTINRELVLCSSVDSTYDISISQRGYGGTTAKSHNSGTVIRFETYEYPAYSEFYVDEWQGQSDDMSVQFAASDWSKFLSERTLTNGFFLDRATVPEACESLLLRSNFPNKDFKSLNRFERTARKNNAILHFDFNESTIDRSGNTINVDSGLRARFFAMPEGSFNKVKDIRADALDRELSDLEKALGAVSFISPTYSVNSSSISSSSMALNIGESSSFSFVGIDGATYSEYFNCVFDGFYTPAESGLQYISIDIAQGGVRVYLDDTLILNDWRLHPVSAGSYFTVESEQINLTAGNPYKIRIEAFHKTGDFAIKLKYAVGVLAAQNVSSDQTKTIAVLDKIGSKDSSFTAGTLDRNKRVNYALYLGGGDIGLPGGMPSSQDNLACQTGGSKYIRLPYDSSWDMTDTLSSNYTGDWSIELYIKTPNVFNGDGEYISMWEDSGTTSNGFEFYSTSANHGFKIKTSTGVLNLSSNTTMPTDEWVHLFVTYNEEDNNISYYLNKELVDSEDINGYITLWNNIDLTLGGRNAYYDSLTSSEVAPANIRSLYLDELLIYNKYFTSSEVADRYTETQMKEVTIYPFLYGSENAIRAIIDEITLADLGRFYIDELNYGRYEHYYRLFEPTIDQHANVQMSINDDNQILSANYAVQIQANKVTVKIAGISSNLVGTQSLWRAPDPTTLAAVNLESGINSSSTSMYVSTTVDPPFLKAGYVVIDNEIIKYNNKGSNQFLELERGQFNTTAASHNANSLVREVRYWDIKYDKAPAFSVKTPFITGILFEEPDQIQILKWDPSSYGAELIICASNNVSNGEVIFAEGTNPITNKVNFTAVAGIPVVVTEQSSQVTEQVASLEENIKRYGLKEITIENRFVTDAVYAQRIANFIIDKMGDPVPILNLTTTPMPKAQLGDKIRISTLDVFDIIDGDYWIIGNNYQYGSGPTQSVVLRKVI